MKPWKSRFRRTKAFFWILKLAFIIWTDTTWSFYECVKIAKMDHWTKLRKQGYSVRVAINIWQGLYD